MANKKNSIAGIDLGNLGILGLTFGAIIAAIFGAKALGGTGTTSNPTQSGGGGKPGGGCNCGM